MKISEKMDLFELAELMDDDSKSPARMCDHLVEHYDGEDTSNVPHEEWDHLLEKSEPETEREYLNRVVRRFSPAEKAAQDIRWKALAEMERKAREKV